MTVWLRRESVKREAKFNEELAKLQRAMRKAESQWLHTSGRARSEKQLVYVERRREYCRAVKKAKKAYKEQLCNRLEEKHGSGSFWKEARAIGLCNKNQSSNLKEVLDNGQVKSGDEAVDAWRSHFQVLLGGDMSIPQSSPSNPSCPSDHMSGLIDTEISEILSKCISQEEVDRALSEVTKSPTCGKDGVSAEMMSAEMLKGIWLALFQCCWEGGITPTLWRTSLVVPVPKKRCVGTCTPDAFSEVLLLPQLCIRCSV